jgi:hypothetical protein
MSILCQIVGMDGFQMLLQSVSPNITVCVRGRHAVGKSEGVYQAASKLRADLYKDPAYCASMVEALGGEVRAVVNGRVTWVSEWQYDYGLPVVERRLSQMTEGDIIGLPELHTITAGEQSWRSTSFRPCDWLIQACQFPVMLFLDERNRALQGVKQAVFQLADSKAFYGHKMHDQTRICVAENVGENYQVEQSDPAEVSRWVTVELEPGVDDWIKWAEDKVHPATLEFIRANPKALEHSSTFEAEKKYPDRRSWYKLDQELQAMGLLEAENPNANNLLYIMAGAFLGPEVGSKFNKFVQERDREIKAEDILNNWQKAEKKLSRGTKGVSNEQYVEATAKLGDWLKKKENILTDVQAREYSKFMHDCPPEPRMSAWALLQKNPDNLFAVHPYIEKLMVATASGGDTSKLTVPDAPQETPKTTSTPAAPEPRKRGRKR